MVKSDQVAGSENKKSPQNKFSTRCEQTTIALNFRLIKLRNEKQTEDKSC